jgi:oxygen-independent coproporphyrinogen-3 oxidase
MTVTSNNPGFGVYVHWPFCAAKCPYCDFNSHVRHQPIDQQRFVAAYEMEIAHMAALSPNRTITSVFFGGGTPSLMQPQTVDAIINAIGRHWHLPKGAEITLEANPSSVEAERFRGYRSAGVNRVSLGVQALNDRDLKFLGRLHNVAEARTAIDLARKIFPRLSFDLIYARPDQTVDAWESELNEAIDMAADHLSLYQLTIEQETPFWNLRASGKLTPPNSEQSALLYEATQEITAGRGIPAYEISNHARAGAECQHNLVYWRNGDYAGIGAGAHGRITTNEGKLALSCEMHPETWCEAVEARGHGIINEELLTDEAVGDEFLLMQSRLRAGFDPEGFRRIAGHSLDPQRIADLISHGMVEWLDNGFLRVTSEGWLVLDAVIADLAA